MSIAPVAACRREAASSRSRSRAGGRRRRGRRPSARARCRRGAPGSAASRAPCSTVSTSPASSRAFATATREAVPRAPARYAPSTCMSGRRRSQSRAPRGPGRREHGVERVARARLLDALGHAEEVQVVVAQHGDGRRAEALHEAQAAQRIRAAVDEVAHEPEAIAGGVERDLVQEPLEGLEASLQVADRVEGHEGGEKRKRATEIALQRWSGAGSVTSSRRPCKSTAALTSASERPALPPLGGMAALPLSALA